MTREKELPDLGLQYGRTLGEGSFAVIKEARRRNKQVAVKVIDKQRAKDRGIDTRDIRREVTLHKHCCPHTNVIKFLDSGEDGSYYWIGMELADGGDLFDKIEPDEGIHENVAHFYFRQLINGVEFLHSKGVAHRDIKPENIFLDKNGNLKIGDFGLAALFRNPANGQTRLCTTSCGSPPYIAPEVLNGKYEGDSADIWSAGIVLFVLFCGATPWAEPLADDPCFRSYINNSYIHEYPWNRIPPMALSLLRAMMKLEPSERYSVEKIQMHPWVNRSSIYLNPDGTCADPIAVATQLLSKLRVDSPLQQGKMPGNSFSEYVGGSQPVLGNAHHDTLDMGLFSEVHTAMPVFSQTAVDADTFENDIYDMIWQDPCQVQFANGMIPDSLSQRAIRFQDLIPSSRFTRFYSMVPFEILAPKIVSALRQMRCKLPQKVDFMASAYKSTTPEIKFMALDRKKIPLYGKVRFSPVPHRQRDRITEVYFVKEKGDPLEWRYMFKQVLLSCSDCILR